MAERRVEVVLTGAGAAAAADVIALGLMAAGALVDFPGGAHRDDMRGQTLRGVKVVIEVAASKDLTQRPARRAQIDFASVVRLCIGIALVLMLFGAELRLNFGFRLDMIVTLAAIFAFWRWWPAKNDEGAVA